MNAANSTDPKPWMKPAAKVSPVDGPMTSGTDLASLKADGGFGGLQPDLGSENLRFIRVAQLERFKRLSEPMENMERRLLAPEALDGLSSDEKFRVQSAIARRQQIAQRFLADLTQGFV